MTLRKLLATTCTNYVPVPPTLQAEHGHDDDDKMTIRSRQAMSHTVSHNNNWQSLTVPVPLGERI